MQPQNRSKIAKKHGELSWLLFEEETEEEILTNPYLPKYQIQKIVERVKLPLKSASANNKECEAKKQDSTELTKTQQQYLYHYEPVYLIKWRGRSYTELTWEPLSTLVGENRKKVKEYIQN